MNKIIPITQLTILTPFLKQSKTVVVGGCFDILHAGHRAFLVKAKAEGDFLIVLLEPDAMVKKRKGNNRPVHTQQQRAKNLSQLEGVDTIILLAQKMSDKDYDKLVSQLKPAIIATTKGDPERHHKERQAGLIGAKVKDVITRLPEHSTTNLLKKI